MKNKYETIIVVDPKTHNDLGLLKIPARLRNHRRFCLSSLGAIRESKEPGLDEPVRMYILTEEVSQ